jgi:hypothetical protein
MQQIPSTSQKLSTCTNSTSTVASKDDRSLFASKRLNAALPLRSAEHAVEADGINASVKLPLSTHGKLFPTNAKTKHKRNIEYIRRIEKVQLVIVSMLKRDLSEIRC